MNAFPICWQMVRSFFPEIGKSIQLVSQLSQKKLRDDEIYEHIRERFMHSLLPIQAFEGNDEVASLFLLDQLMVALKEGAIALMHPDMQKNMEAANAERKDG